MSRSAHNAWFIRVRDAFTLVEILIVVIVLGILAAMVVPQFSSASTQSRQAAFVQDVRILSDAAAVYRARTGAFIEDAGSGLIPAGLDEYVSRGQWESRTPIDGLWDAELNSFGFRSSLGVHFMAGSGTPKDDAYMTQVDTIFDDGDLTAGGFRKIDGDRYYQILAY